MTRDTGWFKSSRSGAADDSCVEVRILTGRAVGVRDSKNPSADAFWFTPTAWASLLSYATSGSA